jgi:hypothetical protein
MTERKQGIEPLTRGEIMLGWLSIVAVIVWGLVALLGRG